MKIVIDNQIVKIFTHNATHLLKDPLISNLENQISLRWPSLLEYLGLGTILSNLPRCDQEQPIFAAFISALHTNKEKENLYYIYDRLFVECLNQIKDLPQINDSFLLEAIRKKREKSSFLEIERRLFPALAAYEAALIENPTCVMHDLILYLAWDRICVYMSGLFDYQTTDPTFLQSLEVLKECLIESYQHIAQQGRTSPGIYRMFESFIFYQMREENLQKHTDADWAILSQSLYTLKAQDELVDYFYIDDAVVSEEKLNIEEENLKYYLTLDSPAKVNLRLALAQYMMDKLKAEVQQWNYTLRLKNILYLSSS